MKNKNLKSLLKKVNSVELIKAHDTDIELLNDDLMYSVKGGTTPPQQGCGSNCGSNCGANGSCSILIL